MRRGRFRDTGNLHSLFEGALEGLVIKMMAAHVT